MAKKLISSSSLFKGDPAKIFESFNQGAENAAERLKMLIDVNDLLKGKFKEVGEAGQQFAKNFDKNKAKDIEALDKQVEELVKSQDALNNTIKQQEKLIKRLQAEQKKKKQEDTAEAKLAKEKVRLNKQINEQTKDQAKENARLRKTVQDSRKATKELVTIEQELGREYNDLKEVIEDLDKVELRRANTVKEAQEQNKALRIIVRSLNKEIPEQAEQIERLNAVIDENSDLQKGNADALTAQKINIGNYKESVTEALNETGLFGGELEQLNSIISTALGLFGPLANDVEDYADNTDTATKSTKGFGRAFKGLNTVFKASLIGLVVTAVASIGAAFTSGRAGAIRFETATSRVTSAVKSLIGVLSNAGSGLIDLFGGVFSLFSSIGGIIQGKISSALLLFVDALAPVVEALSNLPGVNQNIVQSFQQVQQSLQQTQAQGQAFAAGFDESVDRVKNGAGAIADAFRELPKAFEAGQEASDKEIEFIRQRFDIIDDLAAITIQIAELNGEIAKFDQQAGDTTRTLNERIEASNKAIALEEKALELRKEQSRLELEQTKNQILIDLERNKALGSRRQQIEELIALGETDNNVQFFKEFVALQREIDELGENSQLVENYDEFTAAIESNINTINEAEVELQSKRQERLENQRDLFEQNLDFIIDVGEANRALLEQQVNDTRQSLTERARLFDQLVDQYTNTVEEEQNEFNKLIQAQNKILNDNKPELEFEFDEEGFKLFIGSTEIATDNIVELNEAVQKQTNLDETTIKRLLEVIKEGKIATREFSDLDREIQNVTRSVENLRNETLVDEQEIAKIEKFNEDFSAFLATIPKDLSTLTEKELQAIQDKQEEFNERRLQEQEEFEKKQLQLQIDAINEEIRIRTEAEGIRFRKSEEFAELDQQRKQLLLQQDKRNEEDKTKNLEDELKKREEAEKDSAERRKEIQEQIFEGLDEGIAKKAKRQIDNLDQQINSLETKINVLTQSAQIGNEIQEQNLASLRKRKADLERERLETEERLQRTQAAIAIFESYTANVQNDPNTALTKTIVEANVLKELAKTLASSYDGTENTGSGGSVDMKGGFLHIVHPYERIMSRAQNNMTKKENGQYMSNEELAHAAQAWNNGIFTTAMIDPSTMVQSSWQSSEAILEQFNSLEQTLKALPGQMPVPRYDYEPLKGMMNETVRRGNKIERNSKSIRSKIHRHG